jgi:hypothetical protein
MASLYNISCNQDSFYSSFISFYLSNHHSLFLLFAIKIIYMAHECINRASSSCSLCECYSYQYIWINPSIRKWYRIYIYIYVCTCWPLTLLHFITQEMCQTYIYIYIYTYTYIHINTIIHKYTYMYIYLYINTHTYTCWPLTLLHFITHEMCAGKPQHRRLMMMMMMST